MKGWDLVKEGWDLQKERDKGMADWGVRLSESESDIPHFALLTNVLLKKTGWGLLALEIESISQLSSFDYTFYRLPCFNKIGKS